MPKSSKLLKGTNIRTDKCFNPFNLSPHPKIQNTKTLRKVSEKCLLVVAANKPVTKELLEQRICDSCRLNLLKSRTKTNKEQSDQEVIFRIIIVIRKLLHFTIFYFESFARLNISFRFHVMK